MTDNIIEKNNNNEIKNKYISKRSYGRFIAIQALYTYQFRINIYPITIDNIVKAFMDIDTNTLLASKQRRPIIADKEFFQKIVLLVQQHLDVIDNYIELNTKDNHTIEELDQLLLSILRCGIGELLYVTDVPNKVTINEYVTLSGCFFEEKVVSFVNAMLDKVAKSIND